MPEVSTFDQTSKAAGKVQLKDEVFGLKGNPGLLQISVVNYLANQREGNASTKTRGEVSGGGRKPWKQKGTGRARQGSIRAPQWIHGGITFGPKPRDFRFELPKKVRHHGLRLALSAKQSAGELVILEALALQEAKTRKVVDLLKGFQLKGSKVLLVVEAADEKLKRACRNLANLDLATPESLHPYQLLWAGKVLMTRAAALKLEGGLA